MVYAKFIDSLSPSNRKKANTKLNNLKVALEYIVYFKRYNAEKLIIMLYVLFLLLFFQSRMNNLTRLRDQFWASLDEGRM